MRYSLVKNDEGANTKKARPTGVLSVPGLLTLGLVVCG